MKSLDSIELPIVSFDVSKDGIILLGFKENKIAISNSNNVLTLFEFDNDGSFYVQWNDGNILLMLVRGSIVIEFSQDGQLINMVKTDDSSVKNNSLWNQIAKRKSVNIGQASYYVKNDMGMFNFLASSYSQLITEDSQGNQTILYDVNNTQMTKTIVAFFAVIVFAAVVVLMILVQFVKFRKRLEIRSSLQASFYQDMDIVLSRLQQSETMNTLNFYTIATM